MQNIKTLRNYRKKGVFLFPEEKIRLFQDDERRRKNVERVLRKLTRIGALAACVGMYALASYTVRGYFAIGAEIFFPLVAVFAYWIKNEN